MKQVSGKELARLAERKGWSLEKAERWLAPVLNYDTNAQAETAA